MKHIQPFESFLNEAITKQFPDEDQRLNAYPVGDKQIINVAKSLTKNRIAEIDNQLLTRQNKVYDTTFASTHKVLYVTLRDVGQSDVTASGTYHSQRGVTLSFHFRTKWVIGKQPEFSINASKDTPGGMVVYDSEIVKNAQDVKRYMQSIINDHKPNDITNFAY